MKKFSAILVVWIMVFAHNTLATANQYDDTLKLLEITGSLDMGVQMGSVMAEQLINALKKSRPDIDPKAFSIIKEETVNLISAEMKNPDGLSKKLIGIYAKYYTHQDIKDLLEFYQTDLGKKLISTMPAVMQESMMAGQSWGNSLGPLFQKRIEKRFREEGIEIR